jgi:hypothetical protein
MTDIKINRKLLQLLDKKIALKKSIRLALAQQQRTKAKLKTAKLYLISHKWQTLAKLVESQNDQIF